MKRGIWSYAGMNAIEDFRIRVGVEAVYRF